MSNIIMMTKIETCLELCDGDANKFRKDVMKVTGLTNAGFDNMEKTHMAFALLERGYSVSEIIKIYF